MRPPCSVRFFLTSMCFFAPIQWAIENGIQTFDPGAGSPHKNFRGFEAVSNTSLHRFIDKVNNMEEANIDALNRQLPFVKQNEHRPPFDGH